MSLQLMKERIKQSGNSLYEEQIKDGQDILLYNFYDDVSYNPNIVLYKTENSVLIKMYDQKYSASYGFTSQFLSPHTSPIELGDILYDTKKNEYWLCVESYNVSDIHYTGKLGKCSRTIKWQDKHGFIQEIPVICRNATQYNNGEYKDETITLGSDQILLYTQLNDCTKILDHGMHFFIDNNADDPSVYILTKPDTVDYSYMGKGVMSIMMTESTYTPTALELELGVCDYKDITTLSSTPPISNISKSINSVISGAKKIKPGFPRTFSINFYNENGDEIDWSTIDYKWNVLSEHVVNQTIHDNKIDLCLDKNASIGTSIILQVVMNQEICCESKITVIPVA